MIRILCPSEVTVTSASALTFTAFGNIDSGVNLSAVSANQNYV